MTRLKANSSMNDSFGVGSHSFGIDPFPFLYRFDYDQLFVTYFVLIIFIRFHIHVLSGEIHVWKYPCLVQGFLLILLFRSSSWSCKLDEIFSTKFARSVFWMHNSGLDGIADASQISRANQISFAENMPFLIIITYFSPSRLLWHWHNKRLSP